MDKSFDSPPAPVCVENSTLSICEPSLRHLPVFEDREVPPPESRLFPHRDVPGPAVTASTQHTVTNMITCTMYHMFHSLTCLVVEDSTACAQAWTLGTTVTSWTRGRRRAFHTGARQTGDVDRDTSSHKSYNWLLTLIFNHLLSDIQLTKGWEAVLPWLYWPLLSLM